jgi:hypothetical protein
MFICNKLDNADTKYLLDHLVINLSKIILVKASDLTPVFFQQKLYKNQFACLFLINCKIEQSIISRLHELLKPNGVIYINSSNQEYIDEFMKFKQFKHTRYYVPSGLKKSRLTPQEEHRLLDIINYFIKHKINFNNVHESERLLPLIPTHGFFQPQRNLGCGRHALNNLLHGEYFIGPSANQTPYDPFEAMKAGVHISIDKPFNLDRLCKFLQHQHGVYKNLCSSSENYDVNVLTKSLVFCGFEHHRILSYKILAELDNYLELDF